MTDTIDATTAAPDQPAPLDLPSAAPLPPPTSGQPMPAQLPPPTRGVVPPPPPAASHAAMGTGPSAIFSADAPVIPVAHAASLLPTNAPAVLSVPTTTPAVPSVPMIAPAVPSVPATPRPVPASVFDVQEFLGAQSSAGKAPAKPKRRWLVRFLMLGLLGAGGWFGTQHGPALYDEYVRKNEPPTTPENTAPLAFPNVTTASSPIRTAEFVLVGLPETPGATYRVTTDFETSVSQVDIVRVSGPDLQILTYGDDAMIRRADGDQWYLLDRGQFPLDGRLARSDWVRRIDELLPSEVRNRAAIDASTESTISGVPTRRLALTIDPGLLGTVATAEAVATDQPMGTGTVTADASSAPPAPVPTTIEIEVWIDGEGLVRQVTGAPQLGAETITVVRTSSDAWIPDYPTASAIAPLTASALVDLGL